MSDLSSKKKIIIILLVFVGFFAFCIGAKFGYAIVGDKLRENAASDNKASND